MINYINRVKNIFIFFLAFTLLQGCENAEYVTHSYIGGEIINPKDTKLTIFKSNSIIDTARLDSKNRFLTKIQSTKPCRKNYLEEWIYSL